MDEKARQRKKEQTLVQAKQEEIDWRVARFRRNLTTKAIIMLVLFVLCTISAIFYELNLYFGPDENCWQEFK